MAISGASQPLFDVAATYVNNQADFGVSNEVLETPGSVAGFWAFPAGISYSVDALKPENDHRFGQASIILPIDVQPKRNRAQARGANDTGREQNLGPSPADGMASGFDFFERVFIVPASLDLGNVVTEQVFNIELFNAYRREARLLSDIDNNAGDGITISGITPPKNIAPLATAVAILTVATQGPPTIDGDIDFVFDIGTSVFPLTGNRIIIFPYAPQKDIKEGLEWLTDVIRARTGEEQRHALRTAPRQTVEYEFKVSGNEQIQRIANLFVDWTTRVFGVPVWWDERSLAADAASGATSVTVAQDPVTGGGGTSNADFRVGGLAMVQQIDQDGTQTVDVLEISAVSESPAVITFTAPIGNDYDASIATVTPVVPGILKNGKSKQVTSRGGDFTQYSTKFSLLDNDSSVPLDASAYPVLEDFDNVPTVIITDTNFLPEGTLTESWEQATNNLDYKTGLQIQQTDELRARRATRMVWEAETSAFLWQVRSLLFNLRGRLRSVWIPTWRNDFTLTQTISINNSTIDVVNVGFARYVRAGAPWCGLRITKTDGSVSYHRITGATETDATEERLTVDPVVPFEVQIADVERIDMLILSRLSDDSVTIVHSWNCKLGCAVDAQVQAGFIGDVRSGS